MKFRNLKLGNKQRLGFGLILLIMTAVNIFYINQMMTIKASMDDVTNYWLQRVIAISDLNTNAAHLLNHQLKMAIAESDSAKQLHSDQMIELINRIDENRDSYEKLKTNSPQSRAVTASEREHYQKFDQNWDQYQEISLRFFTLLRQNQRDSALLLLNAEGLAAFNRFSSDLENLVMVNRSGALESARRADAVFTKTRRVAFFLLTGTILLSLVLAGILVRWITIPVRQLQEAARQVAEGDLDVRLPVESHDEIGNLAQSFNQMTESLRKATAKMQLQAERLEEQQRVLTKSNRQLAEKSDSLERQTDEIRRKNDALREALEELSATQQQLLLQEKMASLGKLVAGVAHEINNPMAAVTAATDVLLRCIKKMGSVIDNAPSLEALQKDEARQQIRKLLVENIRVTQDATARVAGIVNSLKSFAKLDEAAFQRADIREGIRSSLNLLGSDVHQRVKIDLQLGDIPRIICYPAQLNQVFLNLLKNAVEAIDGNGTVTVKTYHQMPSANGKKHAEEVVVEICDSGHGIPTDQLKTLFEFQFSAGKDRVKMGSGLVTSYSIVQQHQGRIEVRSETGKGSTFTVRLPVNAPMPA